MKFGLPKQHLEQIVDIIKQFNHIEEFKIFGSRALGNYKHGSDIDIAIYGDKITFDDISKISYILNEQTTMPYMFDILHYDTLENQELKQHIDNFGIKIF